jgi:hypothetical protein
MTAHAYSRIVILALAPFHTWQDWPFIALMFSTGSNSRKGLVCLLYVGYPESKERCAIKKYVLIIGKKTNTQVVAHSFTNFST